MKESNDGQMLLQSRVRDRCPRLQSFFLNLGNGQVGNAPNVSSYPWTNDRFEGNVLGLE
jgi:hypothetical protein